MKDTEGTHIDRREFMVGTASIGAATALPALPALAQPAAAQAAPARRPIETTVNGKPERIAAEARSSLLDVLREQLRLTGTKKGCDHGQCGACTVHVDGRRVAACLTLAAKVDGRAVTTIEGVGQGGALHPMQQAFIDHDALQCGYCTPGQVMAAIACVREGHAKDRAQIQEYMSGNLCRCGAYAGIVEAVADAARAMKGGGDA